jgi:hypothetical protein
MGETIDEITTSWLACIAFCGSNGLPADVLSSIEGSDKNGYSKAPRSPVSDWLSFPTAVFVPRMLGMEKQTMSPRAHTALATVIKDRELNQDGALISLL